MKLKLTWLLTLFMAFVMQFSFAQEKTVTGTVTTSDDGLPLPGATVIVKGTSRGQQTDFDGKFTIKVNQGDILVVSYVGMKTAERAVGSGNIYDVVLEPDNVLDEVVVVGYGTESREKVGTATSYVKSEEINNVAIGNVTQILQGRAAGVRVSSGSGQPGADANVIIRGIASIAGAGQQPLYVIDGAPVDNAVFSALNPNDIASVSVLKDAASQSIYGSRGAAGVILITTKKGTKGKTVVQYSTSTGFSESGNTNFDMMNSRELLEFQRRVGQSPGVGLTDQEISTLALVDTDWSDLFFRTGRTSTHDFSISGGNENTQFRSSIGVYNQEGIALSSGLDRYSGAMNISHQVSDKFRVNTSLIGSFSRSNFIDSENSITLQNPFAAVYLGAPYDPLYNEDGSFASGSGLVGPNAYEHLVNSRNTTERIRATYTVSGEYDILSFLTAKAFGSLDYRESVNTSYTDPNTEYGRTTSPGNAGSYGSSFSRGLILNGRFSLEFDKTFNSVHNVNFEVFSEFLSDRTEAPFGFGSTVYNLNENVPPGLAAATISEDLLPDLTGSNGTPVNIQSYFAKGRYTYDNKYTVTLTGRRDESSKFSKANRVAYFWSADVSWNIHKEAFMENLSFVNSLKLRASAGTVGNQGAIGTFQTRTIFGSGQYNGSTTLFPSSPGNADLKWETVTSYNLGLDYTVWNGRISGAVDLYHSTTSDLFVNQNLSATSGFGSQDINAGEMVNKGVEAEISVVALQDSDNDFSLTLFGNIGYNKNEITSLGQVDEFEQGTSILREGLPYGTHYIVGWAGVNPSNGEPLYLDANGQVTNVFTEDNRLTDYGTYIAPFTGGFGGDIKYKGFYLNTLFTFEKDFSRFNNQSFFQENPNFAQFNQLKIMNTMWENPGDITEIQSYLYPRQFSSKDIEDASYLRWRKLEVGYTLPSKFLDNTFIQSVKIYAQGLNLYTWTKWTGFDPEDDNNIAAYEYPTAKTYTLGLDFTF
ncbi:SusC/RagA family TonB-linked outer membrane protein [Winogradskyella sp. PC D3.3]